MTFLKPPFGAVFFRAREEDGDRKRAWRFRMRRSIILCVGGRGIMWYNPDMRNEREIQEEIDRIFEDAALSEADRGLWQGRLSERGFFMMRTFVETFNGHRDLLRFVTDDIRKRLESGGNPGKLDAVLKEEQAFLTALLKSPIHD